MDGLTNDQQAALEAVESGRNVFITGPGGTGKSYLLERIIEDDPSIGVTATTGIAACNIGGVTLHSWAGLGLGKDNASLTVAKMGYEARRRIEKTNRLIVDEISMAGPRLLDLLDGVLRILKDPNLPFGGMQLILTGDFLQLPPVDKKIRFAFEADVWDEAEIQVCHLNEIVRQADPVFAGILNAIRMGDDSVDFRPLFARQHVEAPADCTRLHTHNAAVDQINGKRLSELPGIISRFTAKDTGNDRLVKDSRLPAILELKPGALVMHLHNTPNLFNGQLGTVVEVKESERIVRVEFGGETFDIRPISREVKKGRETVSVIKDAGGRWVDLKGFPVKAEDVDEIAETATRPKVVAARTQFPLRLAWAITVHKSQGMTLERVRVNLSRAFAPGQAYTALSRARSLDGLYIDSFGPVEAHEKAVAFYRRAAA